MPTSTITVGGNSVTLVELPAYPGLRTIDWNINHTAGESSAIFTGQSQVQPWPGADWLSGTASLPLLTQDQADLWISALMACRGIKNAFLLGDPLRTRPRGTVSTAPVVNGAHNAMASSLNVTNLEASKYGALLTGDWLQIGFRVYRVLDRINTDASGHATIPIYPTLREPLADGTQIILNSPKGLFRLAGNQSKWSADYTRLSTISFEFKEYR